MLAGLGEMTGNLACVRPPLLYADIGSRAGSMQLSLHGTLVRVVGLLLLTILTVQRRVFAGDGVWRNCVELLAAVATCASRFLLSVLPSLG